MVHGAESVVYVSCAGPPDKGNVRPDGRGCDGEKSVTRALREFQVFVKPGGPVCNLECRYCYYLKARRVFPQGESFRMPERLLEEYIVQHIEACPGDRVSFSWHGGEPTTLGLEFFRTAVALQRKHQAAGRRIANGIQTNGILIDEEWGRFLKAEGFGVGLSLDGPPDLHDPYRVTRGQRSSHAHALRAFRLLARHGVPCDVLCVVHDRNVRSPLRVYRHFKDIGARYVSFLPAVGRAANGEVTPETVPAEEYGAFLCEIFDEWVRRDAGRILVQIFEETLAPARGRQHALCVFRETCGDVPVVEHNGDFFSCDHFVDAAHRVGNITQTPLGELVESPRQRAFGEDKRDRLPQYCRTCDVRPLCNGGCPKDRFVRTPDGEEGLNYLCPGLKRFFVHALPYVVQEAARLQGGPRSGPAVPAAPAGREPFPGAGRNDPCPCGSGLKYKKCCLAGPNR
jgi:uncharacterized protein